MELGAAAPELMVPSLRKKLNFYDYNTPPWKQPTKREAFFNGFFTVTQAGRCLRYGQGRTLAVHTVKSNTQSVVGKPRRVLTLLVRTVINSSRRESMRIGWSTIVQTPPILHPHRAQIPRKLYTIRIGAVPVYTRGPAAVLPHFGHSWTASYQP
jgi:hypothetical protein